MSHEVDQVLCPHGAFLDITRRYVRFFFLKRNAQFVQKLAFEALMDLNKTIMEIRNVTKAATFKSFSQLSYKYSQLLFFATVFLIIVMRQTLTDDFWGLHKNKNCAFPLTITGKLLNIFEVEYLWITVNYVICILWFLVFLYFFVFILNMEFTL